MKLTYPIVTIVFFIFLFTSCAKDEDNTVSLDSENAARLKNLTQVDGIAHTYNQEFEIRKEIYKPKFFAPVSFALAKKSIPTEMAGNLHLPQASSLPFKVGTQKANIVASWSNHNTLLFQAQFSYFENEDTYETKLKNFFIITASQIDYNPFAIDTRAGREQMDKWDKEMKSLYTKYELITDLPLYFKSKSAKWTTVPFYYVYKSEENKIDVMSRGSIMYYAYYKGLMYTIIFDMDLTDFKTDGVIDTDAKAFITKIILGN